MVLTDDQIQIIADGVLGTALADYGYDHAEAESSFDWDGEPSLIITAVLNPDGEVIPGATLTKAHQILNDKLKISGEQRFPLLRPRWIGDVIPEGLPDDCQ